jgi:hypothetical protein
MDAVLFNCVPIEKNPPALKNSTSCENPLIVGN